MRTKLNRLTIRGFKSIKNLDDFELRDINILIGTNGAGKSNFIDFFRMIRAIIDQRLGAHTIKHGGADGFFFNGPSTTKNIHAELMFGDNGYRFTLEPTVDEQFMFTIEENYDKGGLFDDWQPIGKGHAEAQLPNEKNQSGAGGSHHDVAYFVYNTINSWQVYHFRDTSDTAAMRRSESVDDCVKLRSNGSNIAPYLHWLREEERDAYNKIVDHVKLVAPFFDDFLLTLRKNDKKSLKVKLDWKQKNSDFPMQPYHFSDGTIRFICLATVLTQSNPPSVIILDEPELGLHPFAISVLAGLIQVAAEKTQLIVSTQSTLLLNHFSPNDVIAVDRKGGETSTFRRLDEEQMSCWLENYTFGELLEKNIL
ncbi:MAG: AAA family ATPase [Planctomycetaceae bacterium]|jgi:predicted ATPase|nr:AAA family ATPase [Planctomycetaceae bacterium]